MKNILLSTLILLAGLAISGCENTTLQNLEPAARSDATASNLGGTLGKDTGEHDYQKTHDEVDIMIAEYQANGSSHYLVEFFGPDAMESLVGQAGAAGIHVYEVPISETETEVTVLGTDSAGNDLDGGVTLFAVMPCPPVCGGTPP